MDLCGRLADDGGDVTEGHLKRPSLEEGATSVSCRRTQGAAVLRTGRAGEALS
jgi:hypothetical protein